jgi:hypothetical protein
MSRDNRLWGTERIRGELLKLGIVVSNRSTCQCLRGQRAVRQKVDHSATTMSPSAGPTRAVAVVRVGGIGKTRLAFYVADGVEG